VRIFEEEKLEAGIINARFIKPLDLDLLKQISGKKIIIYEEVELNGSLASLIIEANTLNHLNLDIEAIAINDQFVTSGSTKALKKELGLDIRDIIKKYFKG
jgi:1-deoxy-D-xylulose-5-phosphate synthase